jgi:oligosaccharide repeat unit polymerase wzy
MEFGKLWYRNETSIRVDGTPLISIAMFLTFYLFLKYRDKKYLYTLMFMLLFAIFVNQTRMLIFPQIFSMILMYVYHKFPYMPLYLLFVIAGISCFFFLGGSEWFKNWIDAFNNGTSDMGLGYRYWELKYYLGLLTDYRWINGLGILTTSNPNSYFILFGPGRVQMYLDDLGFIELFVQFGLLAIFLYGYLLYMLTKLIRRMKTKQYIYERSLFIGLMANILITAPSLNIFGSQRSYSLVIILAMVFFYDYQLKRKDNKNG